MSAGVAPAAPLATRRRALPPPWPSSMRAVVGQGLRDRRGSVLSWGLSLGAFGAFVAAIYPSVQKPIEQVVRHYPSGLKQAFGVGSLDSVESYIHAELFSLIVPLALGYFVMHAVTAATVGAEESGRLDTVLALPISRRTLLVGSWVVAALAAAAVMVLTGAMIFIAGRIAGTPISASRVTAGVTGVWALGLFFAGVAALASGRLHTARLANGAGLAVLVGMYALDLAGRLASGLDAIRWASAFRYYGAPLRDGLDVASSLELVAGGLVLLSAGVLLFDRRDVLGP